MHRKGNVVNKNNADYFFSLKCIFILKRRLRQSVYVMSGVTAAVMASTRLAIGAYCDYYYQTILGTSSCVTRQCKLGVAYLL